MRAYYRGDKVRISLPPVFETETRYDPYRPSVLVPRIDFEELRDQILEGDTVRAELKRSLDDALSAIERLSDERDALKEKYEAAGEQLALWKSLAERQDNTAPLRWELSSVKRERDDWQRRAERAEKTIAAYPVRVVLGGREVVWTDTDLATHAELSDIAATAPVGSLVDDLKNTIVSQAREIARLKGESA